jgi:hypothetical protein
MACFDAWDIGACGCGPGPPCGTCLPCVWYDGGSPGVANSITFDTETTCCVCNSSTATCVILTDSSGGTTTLALSWSPNLADSEVGDIPGWQLPSGDFVTGGYTWHVLFVNTYGICFESTSDGYFYPLGEFPYTNVTSASCTPLPTATFAITYADAALLYTAGWRSAQIFLCPGDPCCCLFTTLVEGCNSLPLSDATVNWWTDSTMTSLISSGPAGAELCVGSASTWYRQITCSRFTTVAANKAVGDCYTTPADADAASDTITLTPATGFYCFNDADDPVAQVTCPYPLAGTLYCTFPAMSPTSVTFTYATGVWTSSFSWSGHAYVLTLAPNADMTGTRDGTPFATGTPIFTWGSNIVGGDTCPVTGPFSGYIYVSDTMGDIGYELDPSGDGALVTE